VWTEVNAEFNTTHEPAHKPIMKKTKGATTKKGTAAAAPKKGSGSPSVSAPAFPRALQPVPYPTGKHLAPSPIYQFIK
jgi:hypothetical protein